MQQVILGGLPRSGSTLLCGLLAQNPNIDVCEASTLLPLIKNIRKFWADSIGNKVIKKQEKLLPILKAVLNSYHSNEYSIVIDKHRDWLLYLDLLEKITETPLKILCTVRNPIECAASFNRLYENEPETYTQLEEIVERKGFTTLNRAKSMLVYDGSIGRAYNAIKEASIVQRRKDQMLFIDYHKLCINPSEQLERIYNFLNIDLYDKHYFNKIKNAEEQNDSHYKAFLKTHTIEEKIRKGERDLGRLNYFTNEFDFDEFWTEWT
tara:strand:+ start:1395 stop:2189 length:795 start_codon:yes stop_codon:yes gene_type:complete